MDDVTESCPTKTLLLAAWRNAAEMYSKAVAQLSGSIGIVPKEDYENLAREADLAHKGAREAEANLEAHIRDHGCDKKGEAVA